LIAIEVVMKNEWTGGQYSLLRAILGVYLIWHFGFDPHWRAENLLFVNLLNAQFEIAVFARAAGLVSALLFTLGKWDRPAAWLMFFLLPTIVTDGFLFPLLYPPAFLLVVHFFIKATPYGALDMVGRPDPGENWRFPPTQFALIWLMLGGMHAATLTQTLLSSAQLQMQAIAAAGFLFSLLALRRNLRPVSWLLLATLFPVYVVTNIQTELAIYLLLHLAAFDPGWLPAQKGASKDLLFYDGNCGLCHRSCRFLLAEDRDGDLFTMAPLQGDLFATRVDSATRETLADSLVLLTRDGQLLTRSNAVLALGLRLGGLWRPLAGIAMVVPRILRDTVYSGIAAIRHRLFPKPEEACPVVPVHLRSRFDW